jgi:hypothetical protein
VALTLELAEFTVRDGHEAALVAGRPDMLRAATRARDGSSRLTSAAVSGGASKATMAAPCTTTSHPASSRRRSSLRLRPWAGLDREEVAGSVMPGVPVGGGDEGGDDHCRGGRRAPEVSMREAGR